MLLCVYLSDRGIIWLRLAKSEQSSTSCAACEVVARYGGKLEGRVARKLLMMKVVGKYTSQL